MVELLRAARAVRENAHAPYSKFQVGAAVLANGRVYAGCNVENSSFPLGVCAERNAVAAAVAAGARSIDAVAVVGGSLRASPPCGGCRQVLSEFCSDSTPIVYASLTGSSVETTLGALLPDAFRASDFDSIATAGVAKKRVRGPAKPREPAEPAADRSTGRQQAVPDKSQSAARLRASRSSAR